MSSAPFCSSATDHQPSTFAQIAAQYRIFMLEDLLAEPQEMAYDQFREVIYVSRRCLQGHAASPVEYSTYLSVFDASPNSGTRGTFISTIDICPYCGPHGIELDENAAFLYVDVENSLQGVKGTISIDLSTRSVVEFSTSDHEKQSSPGDTGDTGDTGEFVAEVDLCEGIILHMLAVPESERDNMSNRFGSRRHINFTTPAIRFGGRLSNRGFHVLDATDPVVDILRRFIATESIYILSKNVLLI